MRHKYLVVYDYGMGGIWAYVRASSPEEIVETFPELAVFESRPDWMTPDSPELIGIAVEDVDQPGAFLSSVLDERNRSAD